MTEGWELIGQTVEWIGEDAPARLGTVAAIAHGRFGFVLLLVDARGRLVDVMLDKANVVVVEHE